MSPQLAKAGRYEILEEIGRGSMGVVYRARDPMIGRTVAVKTLLTDKLSADQFEEYKARFRREAQATGILTHPNIVTLYDFGEEHGLLYITMEFLPGKPLEKSMRQGEVFPVDKVISIYEQVAGALDYAHSHQIVHRDIKPANLMLLDSGLVKVTDFGIAKIMSLGMTAEGQVLGTPNYMSPEQIQGKQLDGRSDIFSLGVILYELLTGEKPFSGRNLTTITYKIVRMDPIPPRELDASIHPGLSHVITRALAKHPQDRYQSCRALLDDLKNYKTLGGATGGTTVIAAPRAPSADAPAVVVPRPAVASASPPTQAKPGPAAAATPARTSAKQGAGVSNPVGSPARGSSLPTAQQTVAPARLAASGGAAPALPKAMSTKLTPPAPATGIPHSWLWAGGAILAASIVVLGFLIFHKPPSNNVVEEVKPAQSAVVSIAGPPAAAPASGLRNEAAAKSETTKAEVETSDVRVVTDPAGAEVLIDRASKGESPVHTKLSAGSHTLRIKLMGMRPYEKTFSLRAGATRTFEITLTPQRSKDEKPAMKGSQETEVPGNVDTLTKVQVRTIPNGATILVDGAGFGTTPRTFSAAAGRHTLTISKPGYQTIQIVVDWPKGQPIQLDRTLVPE